MREDQPQVLADHLDTEGMDGPNDRVVVVVERFQSGADVVAELPSDHAVERDDEDLVAVDASPSG